MTTSIESQEQQVDDHVPPGTGRAPVLLLLAGCLTGFLLVATAFWTSPQPVQIALAVLAVFVVPGFAVVGAVRPEPRLVLGEQMLACLGISMAIATCTSVLLGVVPMGLSRESFAVSLGGITIGFSVVALFRSISASRLRSGQDSRSNNDSPSEPVES